VKAEKYLKSLKEEGNKNERRKSTKERDEER
jgi:hypothetical protein